MAISRSSQWPKSDLPPITTNLSNFLLFRNSQFLLVDKTAHICNLLDESKVLLSRPRRFGNSLLL